MNRTEATAAARTRLDLIEQDHDRTDLQELFFGSVAGWEAAHTEAAQTFITLNTNGSTAAEVAAAIKIATTF